MAKNFYILITHVHSEGLIAGHFTLFVQQRTLICLTLNERASIIVFSIHKK